MKMMKEASISKAGVRQNLPSMFQAGLLPNTGRKAVRLESLNQMMNIQMKNIKRLNY